MRQFMLYILKQYLLFAHKTIFKYNNYKCNAETIFADKATVTMTFDLLKGVLAK